MFPLLLLQVPLHRRDHGGHGRPEPGSELRRGGGLWLQRLQGLCVLLAPPQREPPHPAGHPTDEGPRPQTCRQENQTW